MEMAKLLLTSAGFYNERIKAAFIRLCDQNFDKMKTAIITTAAEQKSNNRFARKAKEDFQSMGIQPVDFIDVEAMVIDGEEKRKV
jgi:dipeptidase E